MSNVPLGALYKEILLVYLVVYHIVTIQPAIVILRENRGFLKFFVICVTSAVAVS
jgi:hypothetical protein